jgi:hypothetical protein
MGHLRLLARCRLPFDLGSQLLEPVLCEGQEDEAEDGLAVLGRRQGRIGTQSIGGRPESAFEFGLVGQLRSLRAVAADAARYRPRCIGP